MRKTLFSYFWILPALVVGGILSSCNKNGEITADAAPVIILDSESGVYEVYAGSELVIAPEYRNVAGARYEWTIDGEVVCTGAVFPAVWNEVGQYYVTLTVNAAGGSAREELRVDVVEPGIPYISLPFAGDKLMMKLGTEYMLAPEIAHSGNDGVALSVKWFVDGRLYSTERILKYAASESGDFEVVVRSENEFGSDERSFIISVVEQLPYVIEFPSVSYLNKSTTRYTFPGRAVVLCPVVSGLDVNDVEWTINGVSSDCETLMLSFTPEVAGEYVVNLTLNGDASASVVVICVDVTEEGRMRRKTAASSAWSNRVFEWIPAPGQFIGETQSGGMTGNETTHQAAAAWAEQRLMNRQFVSLGGFGGYITVGFDHSVENVETTYNFAINANAFFNVSTGEGGSNEPGIVYVSQDVNGNGLPDDEWYELRGSETGKPETISNYAVTYYRPSAPRMNVQWTDNHGMSGTIDYLAAFHKQDYYYPAWIEKDSYTLYGTRLKDRTTQDSATGMWDNSCFAWGYADNMGSDVMSSNDGGGGEGQRNGFFIKNAMYADGTPVNLKYIDFIRVQTGVNSKAGWLGEVSTEVSGFEDLNNSAK